MKFLHFSLLLMSLVLTRPVQAQTIIPDAKFAAAIARACPTCITGNVLQPAAKTLKSLNVIHGDIQDLTGINGFTALEMLTCSYNKLTSLPTLPASLKDLDCYSNPLTSLPTLPASLTMLRCGLTKNLTSLPTLPASLTLLECYGNQLTSLPTLPASLTALKCSDNQLTSLPTLPASLKDLDCYSNQLTSLPTLPASLTELSCFENKLTRLPTLPASLTELSCGGNQLTSLPTLPASLTGLSCYENKLTRLPTLPASLTKLECIGNQLTSLPTLPASLTELVMDASITCIPNQVAGLEIYDQDATVITRPTCTVTTAIPTSGKTLNGTSDFVSLPNTISAGLNNGNAVTIEYWFKGTNIQSAVRLQSDNGSFIVAGWGSTDPQHIISTDGSTNGVKIKIGTGANLYDNNWHHVAMTWEKNKPDGFKSYVDGVLVAKRVTTNVNLPTFPANTPTIVGAFRNNNASTELTNGKVARVRIWKVVRTEAQIKESKDRSADYPTTDPNLLYQAEIPKEQATTTPANQIVRIKSFWKPDQYINTLSGTLSSSTIPSGSKADQWELVKIAGTNFIQIKNVAKPNLVLNIESGTLKASEVPGGFHSGHWELEVRANNIMILKNRWKPTFIINIEGNKLEASEVPNSFNSAYWLFETN